MKNKKHVVIKDEALFMSLLSHAMHIMEDGIEKYDIRVQGIVKAVQSYFSRVHKSTYTTKQAIKIAKFLKQYVEPSIVDGSSALVHLLVVMDYLFKEVNHIETKRAFYNYKTTVSDILDILETSEYRDKMFDHYALLGNVLDYKVPEIKNKDLV